MLDANGEERKGIEVQVFYFEKDRHWVPHKFHVMSIVTFGPDGGSFDKTVRDLMLAGF